MACTSSTYIACRFGSNGYHSYHRFSTSTFVRHSLISLGLALVFLLTSASLSPLRAAPSQTAPWVQYGVASWYGVPFHGRLTANGERYDMFNISAAHQHAPLGIHAIVTNLRTGREVRVRINDRGPFLKDRVLDLSYGAASHLGMVETGLAPVKIEFLPDTQPRVMFMVQAGAYQNRQNAQQVHQALKPYYAAVQIIPKRNPTQHLHRVRIGPFANRAEAEKASQHLQSLGYHALILPQS